MVKSIYLCKDKVRPQDVLSMTLVRQVQSGLSILEADLTGREEEEKQDTS